MQESNSLDNANTKFEVTEDDEHYSNATEISSNFELAQKIYFEYDNCEVKTPYEETVKLLKKLEKSIIIHGLFSPNEEFKEIPTENVKYLLIPYFLADAFGRIQANRKINLNLAKTYMDEFIKLTNHYGLVSKENRKRWKTTLEDMDYEPKREEKIQSFKEKKELETKIKNLQQIKDEDTQREVLTLMVQTKILKAIEDIRMINMELQLQEHKEKLEKDKLEGKAEQKPSKTGPMKVWHIPKATQPDQPFMLQQQKTACQHCDPFYNMKIREELTDKVFQPGFSQPTMTLEEFGIKEEAKMLEQQKQQKLAEQQRKIEEDEDSDKDEKSDKKTLKDRAWDDWKDENEKGAGNKMRR